MMSRGSSTKYVTEPLARAVGSSCAETSPTSAASTRAGHAHSQKLVQHRPACRHELPGVCIRSLSACQSSQMCRSASPAFQRVGVHRGSGPAVLRLLQSRSLAHPTAPCGRCSPFLCPRQEPGRTFRLSRHFDWNLGQHSTDVHHHARDVRMLQHPRNLLAGRLCVDADHRGARSDSPRAPRPATHDTCAPESPAVRLCRSPSSLKTPPPLLDFLPQGRPRRGTPRAGWESVKRRNVAGRLLGLLRRSSVAVSGRRASDEITAGLARYSATSCCYGARRVRCRRAVELVG